MGDSLRNGSERYSGTSSGLSMSRASHICNIRFVASRDLCVLFTFNAKKYATLPLLTLARASSRSGIAQVANSAPCAMDIHHQSVI